MKETKVTVVDAIMGAGKTSWAIQYMNEHPEENILYITPYLKELTRIQESVVTKDIKVPENQNRKGKKWHLLQLLENKEDIASTHALFTRLTTKCNEVIKKGEYTLFLDETIAAVQPFELKRRNDIALLQKAGSLKVDADGFMEWIGEDMDISQNQIKIMCQNRSLFYVNGKILMWHYPPEIFRNFRKIVILTYMFDSSLLKYYFDWAGISYDIVSLKRQQESGRYEVCRYYKPDKRYLQDLLCIFSDKKIMEKYDEMKITELSSRWYDNDRYRDKIKKLKNDMVNYTKNKMKAPSSEIMWTVYEEHIRKLKGGSYASGFVACNARATNEYRHKKYLMYCINLYPHVGVTNFFSQRGITVNADKYALAEMLQWIWRSRIREGKKIYLFIPSRRMRELLLNWLYDDNN